MKHFYTINYKLFESRENVEELIDAQTLDLAYRSRENALKAVKRHIKTHIELNDYKPTQNQFVLEAGISTTTKILIKYEIKEHWLSDYEQGD